MTCSTCSKKSNLQIHVNCVHKGERKYICTICEASFAQSGSLKIHIKRFHEEQKNCFKCNYCGNTFNTK